MDETSRCGERRALTARERSGDATSGDATSGEASESDPGARRESEAGARLLPRLGKARSCVLAYSSPVTKFSGHAPKATRPLHPLHKLSFRDTVSHAPTDRPDRVSGTHAPTDRCRLHKLSFRD